MRSTVFALFLLAFPPSLIAQESGELHLVNDTGATLRIWAEGAQNGEWATTYDLEPGDNFYTSPGQLLYGEEWTICVQPMYVEGIEPSCWTIEPERGADSFSFGIVSEDFYTTDGRQVTHLVDPPSDGTVRADSPPPNYTISELLNLEEVFRGQLVVACPQLVSAGGFQFRELRRVIYRNPSATMYEQQELPNSCAGAPLCMEAGEETIVLDDGPWYSWFPPGYWVYTSKNIYIFGEGVVDERGAWIPCG